MSDTLRSKVIRLAHANPALRPHLLPLLKTAAMDATKAKGLAMLTDALKATPGLSVRTSGTKMVVSAGKLNPEVKSIEFDWSGDGMEIPFVMTLKNGMEGWGWDAYRTPPSFYDTQNKLKLQVVFDGKRDPESELRGFVTHILLEGVRRAGLVFVPKTRELITLTEAAARSKPTAPKPTAPKPTLPATTEHGRGWSRDLLMSYRAVEKHFRDLGDADGLDLLNSFGDTAESPSAFGSAKLIVRLRSLEKHVSGNSTGARLVDRLGAAVDDMIGDDDEDDDDYGDDD